MELFGCFLIEVEMDSTVVSLQFVVVVVVMVVEMVNEKQVQVEEELLLVVAQLVSTELLDLDQLVANSKEEFQISQFLQDMFVEVTVVTPICMAVLECLMEEGPISLVVPFVGQELEVILTSEFVVVHCFLLLLIEVVVEELMVEEVIVEKVMVVNSKQDEFLHNLVPSD